MFSVSQSIENRGPSPVTLYPYGLVSRHDMPEVTGFYILHEGLLGVFDETLQEVDYSDLRDNNTVTNNTTGGWLGITDKYWLVALIPDQQTQMSSRFTYRNDNEGEKFQADFMGPPLTIPAGRSGEVGSHLFTGAKEG